MDLKGQKITELVNRYGIPSAAAALCVDNLGGVDEGKLAACVQTAAGLAENANVRTLAEIDRLKTQLKELNAAAKEPGADKIRIASQTMRIKDAIHGLGGKL